MDITGKKLFVKALKEEGVDTIFAYPGGTVTDLFDELYRDNEIDIVLPRHEQALVHEAEGYARELSLIHIWTVGRAGAYYDACRSASWRASCYYRDGHCMGGRMDQYAAAVLGASCAGNCRTRGKRYYGILRHCPDRDWADHLRRLFVPGTVVCLRLDLWRKGRIQ